MGETLKELLLACLKEADPLVFPSQILCLAESISFTCRCEESIKSGKLKIFLESLKVSMLLNYHFFKNYFSLIT